MKIKHVSIIAFVTLLVAQSASAQLSSSFYAFAITDQNSLNAYTSPTTGSLVASSMVGNVQNRRINHLATEIARNRVIYGVEDTQTGAVVDIRAHILGGPGAGTNGSILNGNNLATTIGSSTGGGSFFNGAYYLWDDGGTGQGIVRMTLTAGGLIDTISKPWGNNLTGGELGDIAIDASGAMFLFNELRDLYRFDVNNPDPAQPLVLIGNYSLAVGGSGTRQMFIDDLGRIMINSGTTGDWRSLDPLVPGSSTLIPGINLLVGTNTFSDLAPGGRPVGTVIPEPSSMLIGSLGLLALLRRRRSI